MRINDISKVNLGTKISEHISKDNNGQLIIKDAVLARTGDYEYLESEIKEGGDANKVVIVHRLPEDVFDATAMASFENKPFCNDHPEEDVSPLNYKDLQVGYVYNIRRGTGDLANCVIGDIIVFDEDVQDLILNQGKRELSLGYSTDIVKGDDGEYYMKNIRGNHLALVDSGRAGCATIRDSAMRIKNRVGGQKTMSLFNKNKRQVNLYDDDIVSVEEVTPDEEDVTIEEIGEEPAEDKKTVQDDGEDKTDKIIALLEEILNAFKGMNQVKDISSEELSKAVGEQVTDDDEEVEETEDKEEKEEVSEDEIDKVVESLKADIGEEGEKEEGTEEEEVAEEEEEVETQDSNKVKDSYAVFAQGSKVKPANNNLSADVTNSFQNRYNKELRKRY